MMGHELTTFDWTPCWSVSALNDNEAFLTTSRLRHATTAHYMVGLFEVLAPRLILAAFPGFMHAQSWVRPEHPLQLASSYLEPSYTSLYSP
jgi:hypothetical protein